jgi:DNA-binding response OmpR family regulator
MPLAEERQAEQIVMDHITAAFVDPSFVLGLDASEPPGESRQAIMQSTPRLRIAALELDFEERRVYVCGEPLEFTATEFRVLAMLVANSNQTLTREQIIFGVHHEGLVSTPRAVDYQIFSVRKKLGPAAAYLKTVRGIGYRFEPPTGPA